MDRPILFSGPMVRAILAGTKTQTRRVVKPQPPSWAKHYWGAQGTYSGVAEPRHYWANHPDGQAAFDAEEDFDIWPGRDKSDAPSDEDIFGGGGFESPYGSEANCIKPEDRLWVREAWRTDSSGDDHKAPRDLSPIYTRLCYDATDARRGGLMGKSRPGMFMPRWASRITLQITDVRVERLQDISNQDARAEGVLPSYAEECVALGHAYNAVPLFRELWTHINGPGSWDANPWVWVVEFRRVGAA